MEFHKRVSMALMVVLMLCTLCVETVIAGDLAVKQIREDAVQVSFLHESESEKE